MNGVTVYVTKEDWNVNLEPKLYVKYYLDGQIESINSAAADRDYSGLGMTLAKETLYFSPPPPRLPSYTPCSLIPLFSSVYCYLVICVSVASVNFYSKASHQ